MNENLYQLIRVIFIGALLFGAAYWLDDNGLGDEYSFIWYVIAGAILFFYVIKPLRKK